MMNEQTIAKYEAKGFNRWTKGNMDRLYINAKDLGLEVSYYKTGNVSSAKWCGESISNADARRFLSSKVYVDVKTGELHVDDHTSVDWHAFDQPTLEDKAREAFAEAEANDTDAKSKRVEAEETRQQLIEAVKSFIAERIEASESMGLTEYQRERGVKMLEAAMDKAVKAIKGLDDVSGQRCDGNWLVQSYGL